MSKLVYKLNKSEFTVKVRAGGFVKTRAGAWLEESSVVSEVVVYDGRTIKDYRHWAGQIPCFTGNARKIKRLARKIAKDYAAYDAA